MYPIAKSDRTPLIDEKTYLAMYQESIENSDVFWSKKAKEFLDWDKDWDSTSNVDYHQGLIEWFKGGKLNVAYNCIDRHLPQRANQTAIIWEGDNPEVSQKVTYQQLHDEVATLANGLKKLGVRKGDRVCIYMPMILTYPQPNHDTKHLYCPMPHRLWRFAPQSRSPHNHKLPRRYLH
jgi:acetyl-CoA synthetase